MDNLENIRARNDHERGDVNTGNSRARSMAAKDRTLSSVLKRQGYLGGKQLIACKEGSISYKDAPTIASRCAGTLAASGVKAGDRIAVVLSNRLELIELFLGVGWLGAILVPINTAFRGQQLRQLLELADPAAIIVEAELIAVINNAGATLPSLKNVWCIGNLNSVTFDDLCNINIKPWRNDGTEVAEREMMPGDPLAILYTSGTTGASKGVICPHGQFFWWGVLTGEALSLNERDVLYTILPMFHTNALNSFWQALLTGATFRFGSRFSASQFFTELIESKATVSYLLGSMVYMLLKQERSPRDRAHNVSRILSPATPTTWVSEFFERFGIVLVEGYGSTETNLVLSNSSAGYEPGSMGRVLPEFEVRVVDGLDREVPDGESGELIVRNLEPFSLSSGYFRNPEATVNAWRNLWFHTGDRVKRDSNGVHYFIDRLTDSIRRRGENISSLEVENAIMSHPCVEMCSVIGVPSEVGEEEVKAFVVLKKGIRLSPERLVDFLESEIASFAIPRFIEFVEQLPLTENGKVQKFELKKQGVGRNTWDRFSSELRSSAPP